HRDLDGELALHPRGHPEGERVGELGVQVTEMRPDVRLLFVREDLAHRGALKIRTCRSTVDRSETSASRTGGVAKTKLHFSSFRISFKGPDARHAVAGVIEGSRSSSASGSTSSTSASSRIPCLCSPAMS